MNKTMNLHIGLLLLVTTTAAVVYAKPRKCKIDVQVHCAIGCTEFKKDTRGCPTCKCAQDERDRVEGDILFDDTTEKIFEALKYNPTGGNEKGAVKDTVMKRWNNIPKPNGVYEVPYVFDFDTEQYKSTKVAIEQAIAEFKQKTCIHLRPRKNEQDYIKFIVERGCYSYIGRRTGSKAPNPISIGNGCEHKGTVIHELLHALGFLHEQSRTDRDKFVTVQYSNIYKGRDSNFQRYSSNLIDSKTFPYDFNSVMHYGGYAFSKNGQPTITNKSGKAVVAQRDGFSTVDLQQVNNMYECKDNSVTVVPTATSRATTTPTEVITEDTNVTQTSIKLLIDLLERLLAMLKG